MPHEGNEYDPDDPNGQQDYTWLLLALAVLSTYCDLVGVFRG
ncbi:hypothetical protein [Actinoplanes sp. NPDC051859]